MKPTDISAPDYFHKVVDCQWACPAHTPVPEYIRLIAEGRYSDAYMINWRSNVFPGILGRTCDRPWRPRLADRGPRSRAARLPLHGVRFRPEGRRHDADADSEIPAAGFGDRRGNRLHPQSRHRVQGRHAHRQPEEAAWRKV